MVEYSLQLDLVFHSLSDPTRRDILKRVSKAELPIKKLADHYHMTFAGIAKHIQVLEKAKLIRKRKEGREQIITMNPKMLARSLSHLKQYEKILATRYDRLESLLHK